MLYSIGHVRATLLRWGMRTISDCAIQHAAIYCNRVAKCLQHVVLNNVALCYVQLLRPFGQHLPNISHEPTMLRYVAFKYCVRLDGAITSRFYVRLLGRFQCVCFALPSFTLAFPMPTRCVPCRVPVGSVALLTLQCASPVLSNVRSHSTHLIPVSYRAYTFAFSRFF